VLFVISACWGAGGGNWLCQYNMCGLGEGVSYSSGQFLWVVFFFH